MITSSDEKTGTILLKLLKVLKTGFAENKGQSRPLSVVSKTQGKCQLSVKFWPFVSCQFSLSRPSPNPRPPRVRGLRRMTFQTSYKAAIEERFIM